MNTSTTGGTGQANYQKTSADQTGSLADNEKARDAGIAAGRKIIRNADLILEVNSPADEQRRIASVAEARGGFVVTSDAKQYDGEDQSRPQTKVTVVVRVPAEQFAAALEEIRGKGSRVRQEKITGQDVTEEYLDLEARIRTKKALEAQFMEIMKQARSVSDALEVQRQLGEVRTEIERLEGRRRYLENQASLSTITVTLQTPTPIVRTSGFVYDLKRAFGSGVETAADITLFFVQAFLALLPVVLLIFLPLGLLIRFLVRRWRRQRMARELAQKEAQAVT
ncbi:MAG TPA: DUF4349 domain-containing protein [Pyrinomonadaceae bacterium]